MKVYLFGWPGPLGGAATKFAHLMRLLRRCYSLTVVALDAHELADGAWVQWMIENGVRHCHVDDLPRRLHGWGVSLCNSGFLGSRVWVDVRKRGLKMAWGNEMMWPLPGEAGAITLSQIDAMLYVSPVQRAALEPEYQRLLRGTLHRESIPPAGRRHRGWIENRSSGEKVPWVMVGNYIDPTAFPFQERSCRGKSGLTVGRLSRPDVFKFPVDFPQSYERLGLKNPRFQVMGWSSELGARWADHHFDERWTLLKPSEAVVPFLQAIDLFVYEVGPRFRESWGRAVVEAMLTGAIPLLPKGGGHHLENLVEHGRSGFLCRDRRDFARYARYLQDHPGARLRISRQCREAAVRRQCNARRHLRLWRQVFHGC